MNTDTNQIYWNERDVRAAEARGEPLMPLMPVAAAPEPKYQQWCYDGNGNLLPRKERRRRAKQWRKA